jgi:hypothetical protein
MFLSIKYTSIILSLALILLLGIPFQGTVWAALGTDCSTDSTVCAPYSCAKSTTTGGAVIGRCNGPCDKDTATGVCQSSVGVGLGWKASACTAKNDTTNVTKGVCAELPEGQLSKGPQEGNALLALVDVATNWVFAIFIVLAIIFVLLAAFQFVTGGGDAKKIEEARSKLIWAAVGVIVALLAKGIVPVIKAIVGG